MTDQPALFMDEPPVWAQDPIGVKWWAVHRAHPEIGREFVRLARDWRQAQPTTRCGAKAIFEVLRWNHALGLVSRPDEAEPYKLNSNWSALYARWAMDTYPDLADQFETRTRVSAA